MRWPLVSRTVYELSVNTLAAKVVTLTEERDYWRTRAERLTDAALARAGAIHEPTMVDRPKADPSKSAAAVLTAALAIQEIDSRFKKGA